MAKLFTCSNIDVTGQSNCLIQVRQFLFINFITFFLGSYQTVEMTCYINPVHLIFEQMKLLEM